LICPLGVFVTALAGTNQQGAYRLEDWPNGRWIKIDSLPSGAVQNGPVLRMVYHRPTQEVIAYANNGTMCAFASSDGLMFSIVKSTIHAGFGFELFQDSQYRLFVGTEGAGVHLSTDAGRTWTLISTPAQNNGWAFGETPDGSILYAAKFKLFKWAGTGTAWNQVGVFDNDLIQSPIVSTKTALYVATSNVRDAVYTSTTQGESWTVFGKDGSQPPAGIPASSARLFGGYLWLGTGDGWIYRSANPVA
jgi:hypothetical protein